MEVKTADWATHNVVDDVILNKSKRKMTSRKRYTWSSPPSISSSWKLEGKKMENHAEAAHGEITVGLSNNPKHPSIRTSWQKESAEIYLLFTRGSGNRDTATLSLCLQKDNCEKRFSGWLGRLGNISEIINAVAETAPPYQPSCSRCWASPYCHILKQSRSSSPLDLPVPSLHKACTLRKWHSHLTDQQK